MQGYYVSRSVWSPSCRCACVNLRPDYRIATDYAEDDMLQELAEEYDFDDVTDIMTPVYQKK